VLLKPIRGLRLNKSHPLARGLVGCWLCNEGTGDTVFDLSGNGNTGTLQADAHFVPGKFGFALGFDGTGDYVGDDTQLVSAYPFTFSAWAFKNDNGGNGNIVGLFDASAVDVIYAVYIDSVGIPTIYGRNSGEFTLKAGTTDVRDAWHHIIAIFNSATDRMLYVDGVLEVSDSVLVNYNSNVDRWDIGRLGDDTATAYFDGTIDHVLLYNRALTAQEIGRLYREPFCIFDRGIRPELIGGQIVNLAGTSAALSSLSATAKATRKVSGTVASISDVEALLNSIRDRLETERDWLREALFNGMTANAFKLGTTLSLGWFWVRIAGCSVLYRGSGMGEIDFVNILAVAESEACEISPPSYISHSSGSTYFYVIRRFNNCGYQEHTLAAAVKVSIDSNGNLAEQQPNNIFSSKVEQVNGNKIQLVWFYCPLAQKSQPVCFNVYYDDRTGQIDYQNPLATIGYKGRKFYSHQTSALEAGKYLFAIRPEDAGDIENSSLARLRIQLDTLNPDAIDILRAEAV